APENLREVREQLLADDRSEAEARPPSPWPRLTAGAPPPPPLRDLCRIETPPFAPVRYDTVFFHAPLARCTGGTAGAIAAGANSAVPEVVPGELLQGRFWRPHEALAHWRRGGMLLVPPAVILCEPLAAA